MRIISLAVVTAAMFGIAGCSGGEIDCTDPANAAEPECVEDDPCVVAPGSDACCTEFPNDASCQTGPCTAVELTDIAYFSFKGDANYLAGTYTGTESAGYYRFNVQDPNALNFDDTTKLCEFTWDANNAADPQPTPCADCEWDARVAFSNGVETSDTHSFTDPATGEAYDCTYFDVTAADSEGLDFGYGYGQYNLDGVDYPALYFYSDADDDWGAVTIDGVAYDATTGDFTYNWISADSVAYYGEVIIDGPNCDVE